MNIFKHLTNISMSLCIFSFVACEDDPTPPAAEITTPSESINVGVWFEVSGAMSMNPKGEATELIFEWRLVSTPVGSEAIFLDDDTISPELLPDLPGSYEIALKVRTNDASSSEVYAMIEAGPCGAQDPIVNEIKQYPSMPGVGSLVHLYAIAEDPDQTEACSSIELDDEQTNTVSVGEAPFLVPTIAYDLSYQWRMIAKPSLSVSTISLANTLAPLFLPDISGDYHFEVLVTDTQGSVSDSMIHVVSVTACGEGRPSIIINAPESGTSGAPIEISADVSDSDIDCDLPQSFTYQWRLSTMPAGSHSRLNDSTLASPSFIPDLPGEYVITGQVFDQDAYGSDLNSVTISIDTCGTRVPLITQVKAQGLIITEEYAGTEMAGTEMAGTEMAGTEMAGTEMAGTEMAGTEMAGTEMAGTEMDTSWNDELIHVGEVVSFSARVTDPDLEEGCDLDARIDYHWSIIRLPAASEAILNRSDARTPSLIADTAGDYSVRLVVTDAQGHPSEPLEVEFTVESCGGQSPVGNASYSPLEPQAGDLIALNSVFNDPDIECVETTLSYHWRFESLPAGSVATLNDSQAITPSFTADLPGEYVLSLVVNDNTGRVSDRSFINIVVDVCGANQPVIEEISHTPELINAGEALRFQTIVTDLDLDPSCGERSENFRYQWILSESPATSEATLSLAETASVTLFTDVPGEYEVSLSVTDSRGFESRLVAHRVTVGACGFNIPQVSLSIDNIAPATGETIAMEAIVIDADNTVPCNEEESFSYNWRLLQSPAGSIAGLFNPQARTPSFTPDVPGDYLIACMVVDSTGRLSEERLLSFNANSCGANTPVINSVVGDQSSRINIPASLKVNVSDIDNDISCGLAQSITYHWRLIATPVGSAATLLNANLRSASFIPDAVGEYRAEITVMDETGLSAIDNTTITVGECGVRPPQIDVLSLFSSDLRVGSPVQVSAQVSDGDETDATCALDQDLMVTWEIVSAPIGSETILDSPNRLTTSFTPDLPGVYQVRVRAQDQSERMSAWRSDTITINDCGLAAPEVGLISTHSLPPYNVGQTIRYSADFNDNDVSADCLPNQRHDYQWRLISAPSASRAVIFGTTFPELDLTPDVTGEYIVGLTITDDLGISSTENRISINIDQCGGFSPVVTDIVSDSIALEWELGISVRLSHDGYDPDIRDCGLEESLDYHWAILSSPSGSIAQFNNQLLSEPSLTPDIAGNYELSLTITDQRGQATTLKELFTASSCGLQAPQANIQVTSPAQSAVSPLAVTVGDIVQFDASASNDPDEVCGEQSSLSYHWLLLRVPPASEASLSLPMGVTPWFNADVAGLYRVQLIVSDEQLDSESVIFEVNAN